MQLNANADTDEAAMMQTTRYKAFPHPRSPRPSLQHPLHQPDQVNTVQIHQPIQGAAKGHHQPVQRVSVQILNLPEFHQTLQWQSNRALDNCLEPPRQGSNIDTWFVDPVLLPRSDHPRQVMLSTQPVQWPTDILQRWADFLRPGQPVELYVALPDPPGGTPEVLANVIVVQNPPHDKAAALISVTEMLEDPWHPSRFCTLLPTLVTCPLLYELAGIPATQAEAPPGTSVHHGNVPIPHLGSFPARHGFTFEIATDTLDLERSLPMPPGSTVAQLATMITPSETHSPGQGITAIPEMPEAEAAQDVSLIQLSFEKVQATINQIQRALPVHPVDNAFGSDSEIGIHPDDVTAAISLDPLFYDQAKKALSIAPETLYRWQSLLKLKPSGTPPMAPVITWMVDHERFPQCLLPRQVHLHAQPNAWKDKIAHAWADLLLPDQPVLINSVTPNPIAMEAHVAAHVIVTQQPQPGFETILLTTLDSALPGAHRRHATMAPSLLSRNNVLALAFIGPDCNDPTAECDAWIADEPLEHDALQPVGNAQSCTAAIHRHVYPQPDEPDPWDHSTLKNQDFRVPILIDAALPVVRPEWARLTCQETPQLLWFEDEAWKLALEEEHEIQLLPLPDGLIVPEQSYWELLKPPTQSHPTDQNYTLYLDGAAHGQAAGWSVIATTVQDQEEHFLGCIYGTVQLNPHHQDWVGADTSDNIAAELSAMLFAQNLAMRWPGQPQICIRPDLSLSRTVSTAQTTCRSNTQLAKMCAALGLWLSKRTRIQEIRGHVGHAWNELADGVAKWAMTHSDNPVAHKFAQLHRLAVSPHDADWTWMQTTHPSITACFPPMLQQQIMQFTPSNKRIGCTPTEWKEVHNHQQPTEWNIRTCTANVLATEVWNTQPIGTKRTGQRTLRLDEQWHAAKFHVIGLQEARTPQGRYQSPHYHILSSGAKHKRAPLYGCELWVHKTLPIAQTASGQPIALGTATLTVQHADPRRLFVEAKLGLTTYALVVLHVPSLASVSKDEPDPKAAALHWWDETSTIFEDHVHADFQWIFVDANAPLQAGDGDLFGAHGAEATNQAGTMLESFMHKHQLIAPATFAHLHKGPTTTWTHSTGKKSRKDYILVSAPVHRLATDSWVDVHHDTTFAHEDHLPVALACKGWLPIEAMQRPHSLDEQALLDPDRHRAFQAALNTLPLPTWETGIDDHAALFECQVHTLGQQFFSRKPGKQRIIRLQPSTLDAIAFKRHILDFGRKQGCMQCPAYKQELRLLEKAVVKKVNQDIQAFYDDLLDQLQHSGELHNHRLVYRLLRRLGRKKGSGTPAARPLPMLQKPDGTMTTSFTDQQQTWMQQFSQIEAGIERTWPELIAQHEAAACQEKCKDLEPAAFPGAWQVQTLMSRLKRDRVPGPNLIPPGLLKAGGSVMAKQLALLFTKVVAHSTEPLHWKGGKLIPLWKGKLPPHIADGYRSIFLSNYTTKLFHQSFRTHLVAAWEGGLTHLQCGGRKGVGADVAHHILQCHQAWCKQHHIPSAALFVDLKAAFYTVLRQTFTNLPSQDAAFMAAMQRFGLTPTEIQGLLTTAKNDNSTAGLAVHMQHILRDLLHNTYFTIDGLAHPCETTRGTRPGDPVADVLFNLCMRLILHDFRSEVCERTNIRWLGDATPVADLTTPAPMPPEGFVDVTFVDDCVVLVHARSNDRVAEVLKHVVPALDKAAARRGLSINFDQGKTEVLWTITGKGARHMKQTIHEAGQKLLWRHHDRQFELHICHAYKHLGTWVQAHHHHTKEILARASSAKQQWGQLARSFFTKKAISLPVKSAVFQSLVISRMVYNVHTWTSITPQQIESWVNHLKAPAGTLLKGFLLASTKYQHTTDEMMAFAGLLPLRDQLHANRLRFLARLLQACPPITWALMQSTDTPHSWTQLCLESCQWLLMHYDRTLPVTDQSSFEDWVSFVRLDPNWKGRIRKACKLATAYHRARAEHAIWQRHFDARLEAAGVTMPSKQQPPQPQERWQCDLCQKVFASTRALAMHAARGHGYKKKVRYYAAGDTCPACCLKFHTRKRLSIHLEKQTRCLDVVISCWPPLPAAIVEEMDTEDRETESLLRKQGWWASKAFQPVQVAFGPVLPPEGSQDAQHMFARTQARRPSDVVAYTQLQGTKITQKPPAEPTLWFTRQDMPAFVMHSDKGPDVGGGAFAMKGLAQETAILHIRALVVVHFFSGFRRTGDIHHVVDHHVWESGLQIFTLSVDLCMQRKSGDLATPQACRWWKDRVLSGQVAAAGGGPPCETFTVARQYEGGPRPLRSASNPLGIPGLTLREWCQLRISDRLLRFLLDILVTLAMVGMSGFLEHPQYPTWCNRGHPASIWTFDALRHLKRLNCVSIVSFDQCTVGAVSKKPTTLLLVRLPEVRDQLLQRGNGGRCNHPAGTHVALIGRENDGSFHTAKAKVYPYGLNQILGCALFRAAAKLADHSTQVTLPQELEPYLEQCHQEAAVVQPDYHGGTD